MKDPWLASTYLMYEFPKYFNEKKKKKNNLYALREHAQAFFS